MAVVRLLEPRAIDPDALVKDLAEHLRHWLPTQRWYGAVGEVPDVVIPLELEVLCEGWPTVVWCPIEVTDPSGRIERYQLVLAIHREVAHDADPGGLIGAVPVPSGNAYVYDAMVEPEALLLLGQLIAPDLSLASARTLRGDFSNTSVIYDERWMLKLYRRLDDGPNPDVEVTVALGRIGLDVVPVPVAVWRRHEWDLAIVRRLYPKVPDGLEVARESLRELFTRRCQPRETHRDFRSDAEQLGAALGAIHVGLAEAFGDEPATASGLVDSLVAHLHRVAPPGIDVERIEAAYRRLGAAEDLGAAIRIHGDLHLGQALHARRNWVIIDFEGEPSRPLAERRAPSSPLRDLAGMIRSFHYAAQLTLAELSSAEDPESSVDPPRNDPELDLLAEAWIERASKAFVSGYTSVDAVHRLLPQDRSSRDALLTLFELDKAVYEVAYELAHRPHLAGIPLGAVVRLLDPEHQERW